MFVLEVSQIKNEERVWEIYLFESFRFPFVLDYSYTIFKESQIDFMKNFFENVEQRISQPGFRAVVKKYRVNYL